uniref:Uncharacterized protein n=1 Tax=Salix viminalis TaxID=40686 RepID=A0A6N2MV89_SALVM
MVIKESLRLYPPIVSVLPMNKIGKCNYTANMEVHDPSLALHHDLHIWEKMFSCSCLRDWQKGRLNL